MNTIVLYFGKMVDVTQSIAIIGSKMVFGLVNVMPFVPMYTFVKCR